MLPAKTLAPAIATAPPRRAAARTRNGVTARAARHPTPWLTLFAISSPREGTRLPIATALPMTSHFTRLNERQGHAYRRVLFSCGPVHSSAALAAAKNKNLSVLRGIVKPVRKGRGYLLKRHICSSRSLTIFIHD